jgi:RNA polymerase sigma-70 factor (ECF subfamily)
MGSHIPPGAAGDRELWLRASEGDTAALGELFGRHANAVYNHLIQATADIGSVTVARS